MRLPNAGQYAGLLEGFSKEDRGEGRLGTGGGGVWGIGLSRSTRDGPGPSGVPRDMSVAILGASPVTGRQPGPWPVLSGVPWSRDYLRLLVDCHSPGLILLFLVLMLPFPPPHDDALGRGGILGFEGGVTCRLMRDVVGP